MLGWAVRQLVIWVGAALVFYVVTTRLSEAPKVAPSDVATTRPAAAAAAAPPQAGAGPNSLVFHAGKDGHVYLDGAVNGSSVRFVVDTGATLVSLTLKDAEAAGITRSDLNFTMRTNTANGVARAAPVRLREVRIGQLSLRDVPAMVGENLHISLLGQSFLTRLDGYEMHDGVLTLNYW